MFGAFILAATATVLVVWLLHEVSSGVADVGASVVTSGKLSATDIARLASDAGFVGEDLTTAVAVALAESDGNPTAYNPEKQAGTATGKGSFGLWQIYLTAHPEFLSWDLNDPVVNAKAAFRVYSNAGRSFSPWSTFNNKRYLSYLDTANSGVQNV